MIYLSVTYNQDSSFFIQLMIHMLSNLRSVAPMVHQFGRTQFTLGKRYCCYGRSERANALRAARAYDTVSYTASWLLASTTP